MTRWLFAGLLLLSSCTRGPVTPESPDLGRPRDSGMSGDRGTASLDAETADAGPLDAAVDAGGGSTDASANDAGSRDGGAIDAGARDTGSTADVGLADSGIADSGPADTGLADSAPPDAGPSDAGPLAITIDGVIRAGEWPVANRVLNGTATIWTNNALDALRWAADADYLYFAVEGVVQPANAIVLYLDTQFGSTDGVLDLSTLTDGSGDLDDSLSAGFVTPSNFRADYGWGTRDLGRAAAATGDLRMGWRDLRTNVANFAYVEGADAQTHCGTTLCETRVRRAAIGATGARTVAFFARIVAGNGLTSPNQCLPPDDAQMPRTVMVTTQLSIP